MYNIYMYVIYVNIVYGMLYSIHIVCYVLYTYIYIYIYICVCVNQGEKNETLLRKCFGYCLYQLFFSHVHFLIKSFIFLTWL